VLRNFTGKNAERFRVFVMEALNRWRGDVRGGLGPPHRVVAQARGHATPGVVGPWPPSGSPLVFVLHSGKIGGSGFVSSNFVNISYVTFLKHKNSRK
jgi:hypothetical protein